MSYRIRFKAVVGVLAAAFLLINATPAAAAAVPRSLLRSKPPVVRHPDVAPSSAGSIVGFLGGTGGSNTMSFSSFKDGDIAVVLDATSFAGHAGLFDRSQYLNIYSYAMVSSNTAPRNGVQREQCIKYRTYDVAYGLAVPAAIDHRVAARNYALRYLGRPYSVASTKTDFSSFYCSKLVWVAWRYTSGLDLDADGGIWVWPVDLLNSRYTRVFGYWA